MKGQLDNQYGKIIIDGDVISTYAGSVAVECFGIVGMAAVNMKDGLVKLLKRDYLNHGINVKIDEENEITIDFNCSLWRFHQHSNRKFDGNSKISG